MNKRSHILLAAGAVLATSLPSWSLAQQIAWQQNDASSWIARVRVDDLGMAEARTLALESAARQIAEKLEISPDRPQHEVISKLLIVDEAYVAASKRYTGTLRLMTALPDPSYEVAERRTEAFDTPAAQEAWRPNWVLVVPFEIGDTGAWRLSAASSPWASRWKVPFRDGMTQFLPATIDAEDRSMAAAAGSLESVAEHLARRYQSEAVMMVARSSDGLIEIGRWITGGPLDFSDLGSVDTSVSLIDLRARYLEAFWGGSPRVGYPGLQDGVMAALEEAQEAGPVRYRLVGLPRPYGHGWEGHLQIILSGRTWEGLEAEMRAIPGLNVMSADDRGSSVLVRFVSETENVSALLAAYGFSEG
jgi:hypothetical protein